MDLLQSLAGRAAGAMERLTTTLAPKTGAAPEAGAAGATVDFASALAVALVPVAPQTDAAAAAQATAWQPQAVTARGETGTRAEGEAEAEAEPTGTVELEAAAAEALAAAPVATPPAAPDPVQVQRSLALADPEFQKRFARVVERMKSEFGHTVRVTETVRSQERQNHLYEQGRTRPGQVVTWTRNSNHTRGRAADVIIDGTYDNALGYERLARIAAEEGLRTLGARDPGHVELPRDATGTPGFRPVPGVDAVFVQADAAEAPARWEPAVQVAGRTAGGHPGLARVARVAEVAEVARVAEVAQVSVVAEVSRVAPVASVSRVAQPSAVSNPAAPAAIPVAPRPTREATTEAIQVMHHAMGNRQGLAALRSELAAFSGERESGSGAGEGERSGFLEGDLLRGEGAVLPRAAFQSAVSEVLAAGGTGAAERAARIMELQDGAAAGPMNHVLLRVDNPSGGEDRIRLDLRGNSVDATIEMRNAGEAERVAGRLGDLRGALERHGLEAESLRVRATPTAGVEGAEMHRASLALGEADASRGTGARTGSGGSDPDSYREGWKEEGQRQERRDPSDPRQRNRRPMPEKETA